MHSKRFVQRSVFGAFQLVVKRLFGLSEHTEVVIPPNVVGKGREPEVKDRVIDGVQYVDGCLRCNTQGNGQPQSDF